MRCPRCGFEGEPVDGGCARCGYGRAKVSSGGLKNGNSAVNRSPLPAQLGGSYIANQSPLPVKTYMARTLKRGDVLNRGRYRLLEHLTLPENQQDQGTAWFATDTQLPDRRVVIREVALPGEDAANKERIIRSIASRMAELAQHPGFPKVLDVFSEQGTYYIVLQHVEGETLASALRRQGGALPERIVAEYGRQVCEMLSLLSRHQPPLVHGSINPETIIVSPDRKRVSLILLPLFPPKEQLITKSKMPSGYLAPEQARGVVEPSSDLYALAATLHHAVTGYDPSERMAFFHPPARRLNPAVTPKMEAILIQALRLSPSQRYARPADMQKDLSALIASYPPESEVANPVTNVLRLDAFELRQQSRKRSLVEMSMFAGVGILVIVGFLIAYLRPFGGTANTVTVNPMNAEMALEAQTFQKQGIGLSDGRFAFDVYPGRNDINLKKSAAQAIQRGDLSSAVNLLTQATTADPTDGEAQIYNEDLHVLQSGSPYVTIVIGLAIDNQALHLVRGRNDLQAAFLAQHEVNLRGELPNGLKLRVLIDNSGANNADVAEVAQFVANRVVKAGNPDHIIAVVGWPFSSQTTNARDIIAGAHLPLVSMTASSVKLSGSSPYFFRVNPADDQQGLTLGEVAVQQLHAHTILVMRDTTDPYSVSLANAFISRVQALGGSAIDNPADYFTENTTTVAGYQRAVDDAMARKADLIFMAGFDVDGIRLVHELGNLSRANPTNTYLANLKILGGDGMATALVLGQGSGPDATIATQFPQDMQRLTFTAFGDPDEWKFLHILPSHQPVFFIDWANTYQSSAIAANNAPAPGNDAILTYDAMKVIIDAVGYVHGALAGQAIRDALASLGTGKIPPYQGVSGRIMFDSKGNPIDKAVVVLDVESNGTTNVIRLKQVAGQFF
jgi:ABC-type branched-subunit amino acid transport system substrate-binding protein